MKEYSKFPRTEVSQNLKPYHQMRFSVIHRNHLSIVGFPSWLGILTTYSKPRRQVSWWYILSILMFINHSLLNYLYVYHWLSDVWLECSISSYPFLCSSRTWQKCKAKLVQEFQLHGSTSHQNQEYLQLVLPNNSIHFLKNRMKEKS